MSKAAVIVFVMLAWVSGRALADQPASTRPAVTVFVLDTGGGMAGRMEIAETELLHRVDALDASQRFNVVILSEVGNDGVTAFRTEPVVPSDDAKSRLKKFVDPLLTRGSPDVATCLGVAFRMRPDHVVLLCTPARELQGKAKLSVPPATAVDVIVYTESQYASSFLVNLAADHKGRCVNEDGKAVVAQPPTAPSRPVPGKAKPADAPSEKGVKIKP